MADEEKLDDVFEDGDDSLDRSRKRGFLGFIPSIVITVLKYVVVILFALAVMVLVAWIVSRKTQGDVQSNNLNYIQSYDGSVKPPILAWFNQLSEIRTNTADVDPSLVIVHVAIGYDKDDLETMTELIDRQTRIMDSIRHYFKQKQKADLKNEEMIKRELTSRLNQIMNNEKIKDIAFTSFDIVEM